MSAERDQVMAEIARALARALCGYARERDDPHRKEIAQRHTDLCAAYRAELTPPADTEAAAE